MRAIRHLTILWFWCQIIGLINTATIRNPLEANCGRIMNYRVFPDFCSRLYIDDIIDIDQDHLTYHPYHFSDHVIHDKYHFRVNKGDNFVPLRRNQHIDLNAPMCSMNRGNVECELGNEKDTHFYKDDASSIAVAISNENGTMKMRGIMNTDTHTIDIDPLESGDLPSNRYHVIKKRWTANIVQRKVPSYKSIPPPPASQPKPDSYCVDVLCVVDYSIYRKFLATEKTPEAALKKIRYYYAHVINGVNMRYASLASKGLNIHVRLAGFFIAKQPGDLPFIDAQKMQNPSYRVDSNYTLTYLDVFLKKLQSNQNSRKPSTMLPDFNHATLFIEYSATNLGGTVLEHEGETAYAHEEQHGAAKDGVSGDKGGTSYVGGMCSRSKSTSLVVDHGAYTSAGIATHEHGHNHGVLDHDGEGSARKSKCNASYNYIMAPASYLIDEKNLKYSFSFSDCSIDQIKKNLNLLVKLNRNCLQCNARQRNSVADVQIDREVQINLETLPGQIDNVHAQCEQLYGKGSFMCPPQSPEEMCYRMYCYDPRRGACAIISEQMAADGTPCGKYKICTMGKCIKDTKRGINAPDDCPYPDIPSTGSHCEDATPFMCKNEKFRQKCCSSCNKEFTEEESCKDSHILINGMSCSVLMQSPFGLPGCASDYNVKNMCCLSCKKLMQSGSGSVMIHIGIGSRNGPVAPSRGNQRQSGNSRYGKNSSSQTSSRQTSPKTKQSPGQASKPPGGGTCEDSVSMRINKLTCPELIRSDKRYCTDAKIRTICCKSCLPFK